MGRLSRQGARIKQGRRTTVAVIAEPTSRPLAPLPPDLLVAVRRVWSWGRVTVGDGPMQLTPADVTDLHDLGLIEQDRLAGHWRCTPLGIAHAQTKP